MFASSGSSLSTVIPLSRRAATSSAVAPRTMRGWLKFSAERRSSSCPPSPPPPPGRRRRQLVFKGRAGRDLDGEMFAHNVEYDVRVLGHLDIVYLLNFASPHPLLRFVDHLNTRNPDLVVISGPDPIPIRFRVEEALEDLAFCSDPPRNPLLPCHGPVAILTKNNNEVQ